MKTETYLGIALTYDEAMYKLARLISEQCGEELTDPIELDGPLKLKGYDKGLYVRVLDKDLFGIDAVIVGEALEKSSILKKLDAMKRNLEGALASIGITGEIAIHSYSYDD